MNPELAQLARRIEKRIDRVHRLIARKSAEVTTLQSKINFLVRQQEALSERIYYLETLRPRKTQMTTILTLKTNLDTAAQFKEVFGENDKGEIIVPDDFQTDPVKYEELFFQARKKLGIQLYAPVTREELYMKYPDFFNKDVNGEVMNDFDPLEVGDGWLPLIGKIAATAREHEFCQQVKEKFGLLRMYTNRGSYKLGAMVDLMEARSGQICENCGTGKDVENKAHNGRWIKTYCVSCVSTIYGES